MEWVDPLALTDQIVYPPIESGTLRTWIGVGGSPESVMRAARYGLPLTLAIIGGNPLRFQPFVDLYQRRSKGSASRAADRGALTRPRRRDRRPGQHDLWPHYEAMINRIGGERGWPPRRAPSSSAKPGPTARSCVGSPETVAAKIATRCALGLSRFDLKYSTGTLPHGAMMRSIELFGTVVAPRVRDTMETDQ